MIRLKELRIEKKLNMREASAFLNIPYTTYVNYEKGHREPNADMLTHIANMFGISVDYLIGRAPERKNNDFNIYTIPNIMPMPQMKKIPLLGTIACGEPILAEENIHEYVNMPEDMNGTFALKCQGDSMINAHIYNDDIVFIHQQPTVENGEVAAVLIDNEATLKRFYKYGDTVILKPENRDFEEIILEKEKINTVKILGKAIYFMSKVK